MVLFDRNYEILEIINKSKNEKRISLDEISSKIGKDKSVTSRILNGKYNLDLETFVNICLCLDLDPSSVLDNVLRPGVKRIPITEDNIKAFEDIISLIKDYEKNVKL